MSTPLDTLRERLSARFPALTATLDPPADPDGPWFLDLRLGETAATLGWRDGRPITITARDGLVYGEGADEAFDTADAAYERVVRLLLSGGPTRPPAMDLQALRKRRDVRQRDLAAALDVSQPSVSKLERRSDVKVGTLSAAVAAMGGELEITARFQDEVVRLVFEPRGDAG